MLRKPSCGLGLVPWAAREGSLRVLERSCVVAVIVKRWIWCVDTFHVQQYRTEAPVDSRKPQTHIVPRLPRLTWRPKQALHGRGRGVFVSKTKSDPTKTVKTMHPIHIQSSVALTVVRACRLGMPSRQKRVFRFLPSDVQIWGSPRRGEIARKRANL